MLDENFYEHMQKKRMSFLVMSIIAIVFTTVSPLLCNTIKKDIPVKKNVF